MDNILLSTLPMNQLLEQFEAIVKKQIEAAMDHREGERMIDIEEAAKVFNPKVTRQTITSWVKQGLIPMTKIGGRCYFKQSDIINAGTRLKKYKR